MSRIPEFDSFLPSSTLSLDNQSLFWVISSTILMLGGVIGQEHFLQNWQGSPILEKKGTMQNGAKNFATFEELESFGSSSSKEGGEEKDYDCEHAPVHQGSLICAGIGWILVSISVAMKRRDDLTKKYNVSKVSFNVFGFLAALTAGVSVLLLQNETRKDCSFITGVPAPRTTLYGVLSFLALLAMAFTIPIHRRMKWVKDENFVGPLSMDTTNSTTTTPLNGSSSSNGIDDYGCMYISQETGEARRCDENDIAAGLPDYYDGYAYDGTAAAWTVAGAILVYCGYSILSRDRLFSLAGSGLKDMLFSPGLPLLVLGAGSFIVGSTKTF